ncbi:hypothetical protein PENSPDRAFT_672774, partial [Peniophora sp. CONT]
RANSAAEAKLKAAHARVLLAVAEAKALEAEAKVAVLVRSTAGGTSAEENMHDVSVGSSFADLEEPAPMIIRTPVSTLAVVPTPTDTVISTSNASVMVFDPNTLLIGFDNVEAEYRAVFHNVSVMLASRKSWWDRTNNNNFFKAVPQKLMNGGADVAVRCELSSAYMALEQSGTVEQPLNLVSSSIDDVCMPEYLAMFGGGRLWAVRWHKRMANSDKRTRMALDYDVNATLPGYWASLQPQTRLDTDGCIA